MKDMAELTQGPPKVHQGEDPQEGDRGRGQGEGREEIKAAGTGRPKGAIEERPAPEKPAAIQEKEAGETQKEITEREKQKKAKEEEAATAGLIQQLLSARYDEKAAVAEKMTQDQANVALTQMDTAPGYDYQARNAILEKFPELKKWDDAFKERISYSSPTGRIIAVNFEEGETKLRELVGQRTNYAGSGSVVEEATQRLRAKVREQFPDLKPLPEQEKGEKGEKWFPISDNLEIGNIVRHAPTGKLLGHIVGAKPGMMGGAMTVRVSQGGQYSPKVLEWNGKNIHDQGEGKAPEAAGETPTAKAETEKETEAERGTREQIETTGDTEINPKVQTPCFGDEPGEHSDRNERGPL